MPSRVKTLLLLATAFAVAAAIPSSAAAARYGSRTLASGMHGGDVKSLQRYLTEAGHRTSRDGEFGPRTARALKATESELELRANARGHAARAARHPAGGGRAPHRRRRGLHRRPRP